jgi:VanZ like family
LLQAALAMALACYGALSLWPYNWHGGQLLLNAAEPAPDGGVRFRGPGIAVASDPPAWVEPAMHTDRLELSLRVRSLMPEQSGPARIFTFSSDPYRRNLMIAQGGTDLVIRLRTPSTDANGRVGSKEFARLPGVFATPEWVDIGVVIEPGRMRVKIDDEMELEQTLPPGALEGWDPSYRVALGNELTRNRPWLGEISRALVRTAGSTQNYALADDLDFPSILLLTNKFPKLVPFRDFNATDAVANLVFYFPLGVLFGLLLGAGSGDRSWRRAVGAVLLVAAVSLSMETLQVLVPRRAPSVDDLIFNTLGGALGVLLAIAATRWLGVARWLSTTRNS